MPSNPKKGKTLKCTENLKEFYENEDEFKFPEGGSEVLFTYKFNYYN